jgi:hypothetical protein
MKTYPQLTVYPVSITKYHSTIYSIKMSNHLHNLKDRVEEEAIAWMNLNLDDASKKGLILQKFTV